LATTWPMERLHSRQKKLKVNFSSGKQKNAFPVGAAPGTAPWPIGKATNHCHFFFSMIGPRFPLDIVQGRSQSAPRTRAAAGPSAYPADLARPLNVPRAGLAGVCGLRQESGPHAQAVAPNKNKSKRPQNAKYRHSAGHGCFGQNTLNGPGK